MNPFHRYIAGQLDKLLRERRVVVFYDPRRESEPFERRKKTLLLALLLAVAVPALWAVQVAVQGPADEVLGAAALGPTYPVSIVGHRWQVKIVESNHVTLRPGSIYDIVTYFEQNSAGRSGEPETPGRSRFTAPSFPAAPADRCAPPRRR